MSEKITTHYRLTRHGVLVVARYHRAAVTISWAHDPESARHVQTLVQNIPELLAGGLQEVQIQREVFELDHEIEDLLGGEAGEQ